MQRKAVIFDMDGVLVDTEPSYFQSNTALFHDLGFSVTREEYAQFVGSSARKMWTTLKDRFHLDRDVVELISLSYQSHLDSLDRMTRLEPIPGIVELCNRLTAAGVSLGLASSSPRAVIERTLHKSGLAGYFTVRVAGEEVENGKPHPDIFLKTASLLDVPPGRCLVIEDSLHGVAGARAAGMKVVGFANPNSGNQDLSQANVIVPSFSETDRERIVCLID